jgi:zinc protease
MSRHALALALFVVSVVAPAAAQKPAAPAPAEQPQPALRPAPETTAEKVLDRFVEVTGGRKAYAKHTTLAVKGNVEVIGLGVNGLMESYAAAPGKFSTTVVLAGFGTVRDVYDGERGWESSAMSGVRELAGTELAVLRRQAMFNSDAEWRETWGKVQLLGKVALDGRDVYVVTLAPKDGVSGDLRNYYDAETGLLVRTDSTLETAAASIPVITTYSDYRVVDGVKLPFVTEQQAPTGKIKVTATSTIFNTAIDDSHFAKPVEP